jgi:hypothetical protein
LIVKVAYDVVVRSQDALLIKVALRIKPGMQTVVDIASEILKRVAINNVLRGPIYHVVGTSRLPNS